MRRTSSVMECQTSPQSDSEREHWAVEGVVRCLMLVLAGVAITVAVLVTVVFAAMLLPLHLLTGGRSHIPVLRGGLWRIGVPGPGLRRS